MTTTPIRLDLAQHDSHPVLRFKIKALQEDGTLAWQDLTPGSRTVELWYWDAAHAGRIKKALWKVGLTKFAGPTTDEEKASVYFTASATERFYPTALEVQGLGQRALVGWLRYLDSATSPATLKWIKGALEVSADEAPIEP